MVNVLKYRASMSLGDSKNKLTSVEWFVNSTMFTAWSGAADDAARAATPVGVLMAAIVGLSKLNLFEMGVAKVSVDPAAVFPADSTMAFAFDKITTSFKAGIDRYTFTIPGRDDAVISTGMVDGVIDIAVGTRTAEVDAFIVAVANGMIAKNGSQNIVQKMYVNR